MLACWPIRKNSPSRGSFESVARHTRRLADDGLRQAFGPCEISRQKMCNERTAKDAIDGDRSRHLPANGEGDDVSIVLGQDGQLRDEGRGLDLGYAGFQVGDHLATGGQASLFPRWTKCFSAKWL